MQTTTTPNVASVAKLNMTNFRGVPTAGIEIHKRLTLIAGPNGGGKSSVIQAIKACATDTPLPISKLKKKDVHELIHGSHIVGGTVDAAEIKMAWLPGMFNSLPGGGEIKIKYPSAKSSGKPLYCSIYAAGIVEPVEIESKELAQILNILPMKEDFIKALEDLQHGWDQNCPTEELWQSIIHTGWDETYKKANDKRLNLQREWGRIAGVEYTADRGQDFVPEHWIDGTDDYLHGQLTAAEMLYNYAIKSQALGDKDREELTVKANNQGSIESKIFELQGDLKLVHDELTKAQSMLDVLPKAVNAQQAYECWNCHAFGVIHQGQFVETTDPKQTEADAKTSRARIDQQNKIISELRVKRDELNTGLAMARRDLDDSKEAQRKLNTETVDASASVSPQDALAEIELCRRRIYAKSVRTECSSLADTIVMSHALCAVLEPNGLRKEVLGARLADFNDYLARLCGMAGYPPIQLDEFLMQRWEGRPYPVLSTAQQATVNAVLQIAIAQIDKSEIIVMDNLELLGKVLRNGIVTILLNLNIPAVLGCAYNVLTDVPDISDIGESYWCEDGRVQPVMSFFLKPTLG